MLRQPLFLWNFGLLILIALLHHAAIFFYFYWTIWWFDILMHFLGGLWVSSMILWFLFGSRLENNPPPNKTVLIVSIFGAILVGFLWEVFEVVGNIIILPEDLPDSSLDMVMDTAGGYYAYINFLKYKNKLKKKNERKG